MTRWSTVEVLPPEVQDELDEAVKRRMTTDALVELVAAHGHTIARSSMGRWAKRRRDWHRVVEREKAVRGMSNEVDSDFDNENEKRNRMLLHLARNNLSIIAARMGADEKLALGDAMGLIKALKDLVVADKIDAERERAIRVEQNQRAAKEAEGELRSRGATEETILAVKTKLLGLKA